MRGVFKRPMLRNRISVVAKNACCPVSNPHWEDRKQREEKDTRWTRRIGGIDVGKDEWSVVIEEALVREQITHTLGTPRVRSYLVKKGDDPVEEG